MDEDDNTYPAGTYANGSMNSISIIDKNLEAYVEKYGIKCEVFNPIYPITTLSHNIRDHRKIVVIDEISQDCIRANDIKTGESLTKDSFRKLKTSQEVLNAYKEFNNRLARLKSDKY